MNKQKVPPQSVTPTALVRTKIAVVKQLVLMLFFVPLEVALVNIPFAALAKVLELGRWKAHKNKKNQSNSPHAA